MQAQRAAKIAKLEEERRSSAEAEAQLAAVLQTTNYGFVYQIRNVDFYKIGITENLRRRMDQLKPYEILNVVRRSNYYALERELYGQYRSFCIPQTEYFPLSDSQVEQVLRLIKSKAEF